MHAPPSLRRLLVAAALAPLAVAAACAPRSATPPVSAGAETPNAGAGLDAPRPAAGAPTVEEARRFFADVDRDLRKLWIARDRAAWVNQNFITDDTELLASAEEEATSAYVTKAILASRRFDKLDLPPDLARQAKLLRLAQVVPAPNDEAKRKELAELGTQMTGMYGKAKYCPPPGHLAAYRRDPKDDKACLSLDDLSRALRKSRSYDELLEAWTGWHDLAKPMRAKYLRYTELGNEGAKEIGFQDLSAVWRAGYDAPAAEFEADVERLWTEVKPLYDELHCFARARLRKKYGKDKVPEKAPIPAHLLGNMWAQEWGSLYDLLEPYPGQGSLDVDKKLREKKLGPEAMVKLGESFFVSLGLDPLPKTFWERSLFARPKDRDVVCHASAWDVTWSDDLRIKMCIEPTEEDLVTIHHELGHDYYFHAYHGLPALFQQGANDGFHEGIGDTIALSVTPQYLKKVGLLDQAADGPKATVNVQLKMALDKVAFLPFGLLIDKWRWDLFSGKTPKEKANASWWELRKKFQGVAPAVARGEEAFDPGAKYHVPASTPYVRYFLARIYQFQFHKALCQAAGHTGPLHTCSIHGNKAAGAKLEAMLELGASKPWPEAMAAVSGEKKANAGPMLEYFAPLRAYLAEQTKGEQCGW